VRELGESARFEHTEADGHDDFLPLGIGDLDRLATSLSALAHGTRQQDGADSRPKDPRDHGAYTVQALTGRRIRGMGRPEDLLEPSWFPGSRRHVSPRLDKSEQGQGWQ